MYTTNMMDKKRILEHKINVLLEMFPIVAIIGPRQSGKSTLARMTRKKWKYYDLEKSDHYNLMTSDPVSFFNLNPENIIIDEAQQYPEIFKILRGVIDEDRSKRGRFIITGSSSPDIVKGLNESLAGRIATIEMAPFKFSEYYSQVTPEIYSLLTSKDSSLESFLSISPITSMKNVHNFWFLGGYPEPLIEDSPLFYKHWMENYLSNYFSRDIRSLFPKLNIHNFRRFITLLAQHSGHQLNMSNMARALEVNSKTIKDYLDIVHDTFIWRNLEPFEKNILKKVQKSNRGFFRDQGILHQLLKIQSVEELLLHPVCGASFESFVIEEIIRGLESTLQTQTSFHYYRTKDKSEIDLIIDGPNGIIPIEIKLGTCFNKKSLKAMKNFIADTKCTYGILVNSSNSIERLDSNIIQIPINYF